MMLELSDHRLCPWWTMLSILLLIQVAAAQTLTLFTDGACQNQLQSFQLTPGKCMDNLPGLPAKWASYSWTTDIGSMAWYNSRIAVTVCADGDSSMALHTRNVGWVAGCHSYDDALDQVQFVAVQFLAETNTIAEKAYTPTQPTSDPPVPPPTQPTSAAPAPPQTSAPPAPPSASAPPTRTSAPPTHSDLATSSDSATSTADPLPKSSKQPIVSAPSSSPLTSIASASDSTQRKSLPKTKKHSESSFFKVASNTESDVPSPISSTLFQLSTSSSLLGSASIISPVPSLTQTSSFPILSSTSSQSSRNAQPANDTQNSQRVSGLAKWQKILIVGIGVTAGAALLLLYYCCRCAGRHHDKSVQGINDWASEKWDAHSQSDAKDSVYELPTRSPRQAYSPSVAGSDSNSYASRTHISDRPPTIPWTPTVVSHRLHHPSVLLPQTEAGVPASPYEELAERQSPSLSPTRPLNIKGSQTNSPTYRKPVPLENGVPESPNVSASTPISRWLNNQFVMPPSDRSNPSEAPTRLFHVRDSLAIDDDANDDTMTSVSRRMPRKMKVSPPTVAPTAVSGRGQGVPVSEYILDAAGFSPAR